jgi:hypothetical protein
MGRRVLHAPGLPIYSTSKPKSFKATSTTSVVRRCLSNSRQYKSMGYSPIHSNHDSIGGYSRPLNARPRTPMIRAKANCEGISDASTTFSRILNPLTFQNHRHSFEVMRGENYFYHTQPTANTNRIVKLTAMWKELCVNILEGVLVNDSFRALRLLCHARWKEEKKEKTNFQS